MMRAVIGILQEMLDIRVNDATTSQGTYNPDVTVFEF